ncbi:MAG: Sec-independent protein translocase protein TatB [Chloroflexota bacterium]|nr:Sec-independent protein translocase protein TatB [Chloroflexota bacterium]
MLYSTRDFATAACSGTNAEMCFNEDTPPMFGIGYQEMFIVLVVALVIFGPSRLPELAGQVGRWVRDFRRMSSDLTGEFEKTFAEVDEVKKSFKREIQSIQDEVEGVGKSARGDLKKSATKTAAAGKKSPAGALKSGAAPPNKGAAGAKAAVAAGKPNSAAKQARPATNVAVSRGGHAVLSLPAATKSDPLSDVSLFNLDLDTGSSSNGSIAPTNGLANLDADDALSRVRRRRATASYGQRHSA